MQSTLERALNFFNRLLETVITFAPWLWIFGALLVLGLGLYALDKSAIIAAGLGILALGKHFALPVIVSSLAPLAFLSGGNAGLWLVIAGLIFVVSLLPVGTLERLRPARKP